MLKGKEICLLIVLVLLFTGSVLANEFEGYVGTSINPLSNLEGADGTKVGIGFLGGVRYWLNDEVALGAEVDTINFLSWDRGAIGEYKANTVGLWGTATYKLPIDTTQVAKFLENINYVKPEDRDIELKAYGAVGICFTNSTVIDDEAELSGSNHAYKFGVESTIPLSILSDYNLSINNRISFRNYGVRVKDSEENYNDGLNFDGLKFTIGINSAF